MISKNRIKLIVSLQQKKFREETSLFVAEGEKIVRELLASDWKVEAIYATKDWLMNQNPGKSNTEINEVDEQELKRLSSLKTPNNVVAIVAIPQSSRPFPLNEEKLVLALDAIRDPGNLGTMVRLADWFGIRTLLCSEDTTDIFNPKVVQATMGSIFRIHVRYGPLENFLILAKKNGFRLNAAVLKGENIFQLSPPDKELILLGNEARGIREDLVRICDRRISIPPHASGIGAESLNVSTAAAVLCAEFNRASGQFYSK